MKLWTLHPKYLDGLGLVALWREALLAQKILNSGADGQNAQLARFRTHPDPMAAIGAYLRTIHNESVRRGYRFDASLITSIAPAAPIRETRGQLASELEDLSTRLTDRNPKHLDAFEHEIRPCPNPMFKVVPGPARSLQQRLKEQQQAPDPATQSI